MSIRTAKVEGGSILAEYDSAKNEEDIQIVSFTGAGDYRFTAPVSFSFRGENTPVKKWRDVYVRLVNILFREYPERMASLVGGGPGGKSRIDIAEDASILIYPKELENGLYLDTNWSASDIVRKIRGFLDFCGVDLDDVRIGYVRTGQNKDVARDKPKKAPPALPQDQSRADSGIQAVLRAHFAYGYRCGSIIERTRFRQFAEAMGISLTESDEDLEASILSSGFVFDGKVYCPSEKMPMEMREMTNRVLSSGARLVFYECLYENEMEWMDAHAIPSASLLKEYLKMYITDCSFYKYFMVFGPRHAGSEVAEEIRRVWGSEPVQSMEVLSERLPYVPKEKIKTALSITGLFAHAHKGEYFLVERLRITADEESEILDFVSMECDRDGFVPLSDIPLDSVEEENYEITRPTILNAIYQKFLSARYQMNRKEKTLTPRYAEQNSKDR